MAVAVTYISEVTDTNDANSYTFSSQSIGTAASDRIVVAIASCETDEAPLTTPPTMTIDGSDMALGTWSSDSGFDGSDWDCGNVGIFYRLFPTGTTAEFIVTWPELCYNQFLHIYKITGAREEHYHADVANGAPATNSDQGSDSVHIKHTADTGIVAHFIYTAGGQNLTFTGLSTTDLVDTSEFGSSYASGSGLKTSAGTTHINWPHTLSANTQGYALAAVAWSSPVSIVPKPFNHMLIR